MKTSDRTEMMIALRACRSARQIASRVLYPRLRRTPDEQPKPQIVSPMPDELPLEPFEQDREGCPSCRAEVERHLRDVDNCIIFCADCGRKIVLGECIAATHFEFGSIPKPQSPVVQPDDAMPRWLKLWLYAIGIGCTAMTLVLILRLIVLGLKT